MTGSNSPCRQCHGFARRLLRHGLELVLVRLLSDGVLWDPVGGPAGLRAAVDLVLPFDPEKVPQLVAQFPVPETAPPDLASIAQIPPGLERPLRHGLAVSSPLPKRILCHAPSPDALERLSNAVRGTRESWSTAATLEWHFHSTAEAILADLATSYVNLVVFDLHG